MLITYTCNPNTDPNHRPKRKKYMVYRRMCMYVFTPTMQASAPTTIGATPQPSGPELPRPEGGGRLCDRGAAPRSRDAPLRLPRKAAYNRTGCKGVAQTMS